MQSSQPLLQRQTVSACKPPSKAFGLDPSPQELLDVRSPMPVWPRAVRGALTDYFDKVAKGGTPRERPLHPQLLMQPPSACASVALRPPEKKAPPSDPSSSPRHAFELARPSQEVPSPPLEASDTYLLPLHRPPKPRVNIKIKWPRCFYQHEPYANLQLSKLYDRDGTCFVITQSVKRGSEGKVRFAWRQDELEWARSPRCLAAKEWHHQPSRMREGGNANKTSTTQRAQVCQEIHRTIYCQGVVNAIEAYYDLLPPDHEQSLRKARVDPIAMGVHATIETAHKSYMLMPRAATSLSSFFAELDVDLRPFAAMSLWAQLATNLDALHDDGAVVHHDVAPANIVIFANAQARLIDFGGTTLEHEPRYRKKGIISTLVPPEAVLPLADTGVLAEQGAEADIFCAAASLVGSYGDSVGKNLFLHANVNPQCSSKQQHFTCLFRAMEEWLDQITDPLTRRVTVSRLLAGPDGALKDFFKPIAQGQPALCEILMNDAMALQPENRLSATALAFEARRLLPNDPVALNRLITAINNFKMEAQRGRLTEAARRYNAWETAMSNGLGQNDLHW